MPTPVRRTVHATPVALLTCRLLAGTALGLSLAWAAGSRPAYAQDNSAGPPTALPPATIEGSGAKPESDYRADQASLPKLTQPLLDTPQSITVIPRQIMDDQNVLTLRDTLRMTSGISLAAGEASSQGDNLTIRGFTARNDFYLDGMRDFGSYYRDPFNYDRVEVLKGPSSILFGRGSTGGVVNQVEKTPLLDNFVAGTATLGSDNTKRFTGDVNQTLGAPGSGAAFRLNLMGTDANVADRDVAENRRFGFAPSLAFGLGTPTRVNLGYYHVSERDVPDYGVPWLDIRRGPTEANVGFPAPVPRNSYYGFAPGNAQSGNFLNTDADIGTVKVEHDVDDSITVRDQLRYAWYTRNVRATEPQVAGILPANVFLPSLTVTRNEITTQSTESFLQNQSDVTAHFGTGFIEHTLVGGVELTRETSDPNRTTYTGVPTTGLFNPNPYQPFAGVPNVTSRVNTTADSVAFYLLDTLKFSPQWELTAGMRWDRFAADFAQSVSPDTAFTRIDEMPTWRTALTYKPRPNGSVYVAAGTSFNPSAEALSLTAGTANLPPETTQSVEVGSKWDLFDDRLALRGALFRIHKDNAREPSPNPLFSGQMILAGDQLVDGFEIEATGRLTDRWQVLAGYTYLDSTLVSGPAGVAVGQPIANAPQNTVATWTTYQLPWWGLQVGTGLNYVSSRLASSTPDANGFLHRAGDYYTVSAMVKAPVTDQISVQVNAYNITNEYYYDQIHPAHIVPGAGPTVLMSTSFRF
jgi:catecholate siderophore receptor